MGIPMWELSKSLASAHFLHRHRHNSMLAVRREGSARKLAGFVALLTVH